MAELIVVVLRPVDDGWVCCLWVDYDHLWVVHFDPAWTGWVGLGIQLDIW